MKLHFEANLDYQHAAIEVVCDLFRGEDAGQSLRLSEALPGILRNGFGRKIRND